MNKEKLNIKTLKKLIFISFIMFLFSFSLIPLYNVICDVTGLNGNTSNLKEKSYLYKKSTSIQKLNIQFISHELNEKNLQFAPSEFSLEVSPGKVYSTFYIAKNKSNNSIVGQAVPSVAPNEASKYLKKIDCFCFDTLTFKPGESVNLPVYFYIDENMPSRIKTLTLSYSFFENLDVAKK